MNVAPIRAALLASALASAFVCGACGEGGPPSPHDPSNPGTNTGVAPPGGPTRGVVPLSFEAKKTGSKPFPFAFVDGKIGGEPTRFIIDTGAGVHTIDSSLAAKLGAAPNASAITIDGWGALLDHAVAVRELPPSIRAHGIGGVIAPQLLAEFDKAVVVDFINQKMSMAPKSTAWSAMDDVGALLTPPAQRRPCAANLEGVAGVALAVDGTVDGEPMHLAIDSGASRSILVEGSRGGAKATAHPVLGRSVAASSSADIATSIYGGVPFTVGAWSSTVDVGVTTPHRQPQCGAEGRIGMDVLQQCALAMAADEFLVACRAPGR